MTPTEILTRCISLFAALLLAASALSAEPLSDREVMAKCITYAQVGGTSADKRVLGIGPGITNAGWEPFIRGQAAIVERTGCRGIWFHNPWGHDGVWPMRWDQRPILLSRIDEETDPAIKEKLVRIEDTFLPAMRKYLRGNWTPSNKKPHVWCYLGTAHLNPTMDEIKDKPASWTWRWRQACYPLLLLAQEFPGQVSIGMDRTLDTPVDHPHYAGALLLESLGIEVIGEPRPYGVLAKPPNDNMTHWHRFGVVQVVREGGWDRSDPENHPDSKQFATDAQIQGARYAIINPKDWASLDSAKRIIAERGWTPVQPLGGIK